MDCLSTGLGAAAGLLLGVNGSDRLWIVGLLINVAGAGSSLCLGSKEAAVAGSRFEALPPALLRTESERNRPSNQHIIESSKRES